MQIIAVRLASMRVTAQKPADADMMIADAETVRAIKTTNVSRNLESVSYAIRSRQYPAFVGGCTVPSAKR